MNVKLIAQRIIDTTRRHWLATPVPA